MSFPIDDDVPLEPAKPGRKPGSKDSRKFANRGRPPKREAVQRAVEAVRAGGCSIEGATHRFFDSYIESKRTTTEAERRNDGRFNEFQLKIVDELRRNPLDWKARKPLVELHDEKASKYPRYKKKVVEKQKQKVASIINEISGLPIVKIEDALKSSESDE